jgi:RNA polymerase sigma-70 factor, ECF subfamily
MNRHSQPVLSGAAAMEYSGDDKLVARCRAGDQDAARVLFDRFVDRLLVLARGRIGHRLASRFDAEDVVQSVFRTFFIRLRNDEFDFHGQDDLFKLLVRITVHKTLRAIAHHRAAKRDPGHEALQPGSSSDRDALAQALDAEPSPDTIITFVDQLEHFLKQLPALDRQILELRLLGHSTEEIAAKVGIYDRKVRRVLERIRSLATEQHQELFN